MWIGAVAATLKGPLVERYYFSRWLILEEQLLEGYHLAAEFHSAITAQLEHIITLAAQKKDRKKLGTLYLVDGLVRSRSG